LLIEPTHGDAYSFRLSNYAEPHVCGFFRDAVSTGLIERLPETCVLGISLEETADASLSPLPDECTGLIEPLQCDDYLACKPVVMAPDGGTMRKPGCAP
jgi:hypothetical protein